MFPDSEVLSVIKVSNGEKLVGILLENGRLQAYSKTSQMSGISLGNVEYAVVEPKLFRFEILDGNRLHITCPYTQPYTPTVSVYLARIKSGFITL